MMTRGIPVILATTLLSCATMGCHAGPSPAAAARPPAANSQTQRGNEPNLAAQHSATKHASPSARTGGVNVQAAVRESDAGKAEGARLRAIFEQRQRKLDVLQVELKKDQDALERRKNTIQPDLQKAEYEALQKRYLKLQQTFVDYQKELSDKDAEAVASVATKARSCASQIGEGLGLDAVYDKTDDSVLWNKLGVAASADSSRKQPRYELTSDVILCINGSWRPSALAASNSRAGATDTAAAVTASKGAMTAKEQLMVLHGKKQQELDAAQNRLAGERDALEQVKSSMPPAKFKKATEAFQERLAQLQVQFVAAQAELKKREDELVAPLMIRARQCAGKVGQRLGMDAVYDRSDESVVWSKPGQNADDPGIRRQVRTDLTQDVVKCVDAAP